MLVLLVPDPVGGRAVNDPGWKFLHGKSDGPTESWHMSHSLNSFKAVLWGIHVGAYFGGY